MARIEDIYKGLEQIKSETIEIIENRGLLERTEYEALLTQQYFKEKALKRQLIELAIKSIKA